MSKIFFLTPTTHINVLEIAFVIMGLLCFASILSVWRKLNAGQAFFNQDLERKMGVVRNKEDPLLRSPNTGFLNYPNLKQYLKLNKYDSKVKIPDTPDFKESFDVAFDSLREVAHACLAAAAKYPVVRTDGLTRYSTIPYIDEALYQDADKLASTRSSLAMVEYFVDSESYQEAVRNEMEEQKVGEDQKQAVHNQAKIDACKIHTDTGILTLIQCSDVPGLQVQHKVTKEWLTVETTHTPMEDFFVVPGQKMHMFRHLKAASTFEPCVHRVELKEKTYRTSLLYFMDAGKEQ